MHCIVMLEDELSEHYGEEVVSREGYYLPMFWEICGDNLGPMYMILYIRLKSQCSDTELT